MKDLIISIDPVAHTIDLNTDTYYPIHGFIKICCQEGGCNYTFVAQVQRTHILEDYIELRKQTVNVVLTKYLKQLMETGLRYVVIATPILIIDNITGDVQIRNIFVQIERYIQEGIVKPHSMEVDSDQTGLPNSLKHIFPAEEGIYIGNLLYGDTRVYIPIKYLPYHLALFGITGSGKSNLMQVILHSTLNYNAEQIFHRITNRKPLVGMLAIDPHDEYAFGTEENAGLQHIIQSMQPTVAHELMGDFYYIHPHGTRIPSSISPYSMELLIGFEEIIPLDLLNVIDFTPQQAELMLATHGDAGVTWIDDILHDRNIPRGTHETTIPAVKRRLRALERSRIFQAGISSQLLAIVDALDTGKILDVNVSLLSDFEQFLFTTIVARTIFNIRRALKSSTNVSEFRDQLSVRLPSRVYNAFIKSEDRIGRYLSSGDRVKDPRDMPIVIFVIEEAPSLLNPQMMRGQNIFKDISRQGRKFNIGLCVISQQITTLDPAIMSNLNTMIHLPIGSDYERTSAIRNATGGITKDDLQSLDGTLGIAIISGIWLTNFQKIQIPRYSEFFRENISEFQNLSTGGSRISI